MDELLQQLQDKRNQLAAELHKLAETQDKWTAEDLERWAKLNADYDANLKALNDRKAKLDAETAERRQIQDRLQAVDQYQQHAAPAARELANIGRDGGTIAAGPQNRNLLAETRERQEHQFATALQGWLRYGDPRRGEVTAEHVEAARTCGIVLSAGALSIRIADTDQFHRLRNGYLSNPRNALSSQGGAAGGFTYGESFVASLEKAMLAFGGMQQVAGVMRTSTAEPIRWPTSNDTGNSGRQIGESAAVAALDPTFAQKVWYAYKFTSDEILVPFELLRDNAVNLVGELPMMLGERLGRILNSKFTTGTGAGTPTGITVAAAAGVTAASATAIAFDELIDLEHSLDPSRRRMPGVGYMFHDAILKALRKLKDGEGRYLWQAGANSGAPDTLNTFPYTINQDMASSIASAAITILFGQFSQYKIRMVNEVRLYRLVERHRENDQDAFLAFVEADGNLLDAGDNPVKKLTQA